MKIIVHGAAGRMGSEVIRLVENSSNEIAAKVDAFGTGDILTSLDAFDGDADCIIDFSNHTATKALLDYATKRAIPVVLATTGHTAEELELIRDAARSIPVFFSANMSLGVALLCSLAKSAALAFPDADIEIVEKHHNRKLDVPSGTALMLADSVKEARPDAEYVIGRYTFSPPRKRCRRARGNNLDRHANNNLKARSTEQKPLCRRRAQCRRVPRHKGCGHVSDEGPR